MIAVCPNPFRDNGLKITARAVKLLSDVGFETAVCPVFADESENIIPADIVVSDLDEIAQYCSLVIVIGGDGTILAVSRHLKDFEVPMLGVNLGTKGFMASLEAEDIGLVVNAARGEYTISKRMMLDVSVRRDDREIYTDCALNDAVIHGYGDCVKITAWCNSDKITRFSGDGVILSTPTGSTGYSMSAGGPIVEPEAANIIVSPICPHAMGSRSFVLDPERVITIDTGVGHGRRAYLSVDGNSVLDIENGDTLMIRRSEHYTFMVNMGLKSYYEIAFEKLM